MRRPATAQVVQPVEVDLHVVAGGRAGRKRPPAARAAAGTRSPPRRPTSPPWRPRTRRMWHRDSARSRRPPSRRAGSGSTFTGVRTVRARRPGEEGAGRPGPPHGDGFPGLQPRLLEGVQAARQRLSEDGSVGLEPVGDRDHALGRRHDVLGEAAVAVESHDAHVAAEVLRARNDRPDNRAAPHAGVNVDQVPALERGHARTVGDDPADDLLARESAGGRDRGARRGST